MRQIRRSKRTLPPKRVKELKELAKKIDREEKAAILAEARDVFSRHALLKRAISALKEERERLGLSLDEVARRSGIDKANLSRMENGLNANPTIDTIQRYAKALNKVVEIRLVDAA